MAKFLKKMFGKKKGFMKKGLGMAKKMAGKDPIGKKFFGKKKRSHRAEAAQAMIKPAATPSPAPAQTEKPVGAA